MGTNDDDDDRISWRRSASPAVPVEPTGTILVIVLLRRPIPSDDDRDDEKGESAKPSTIVPWV